jgi:hypothetical protein
MGISHEKLGHRSLKLENLVNSVVATDVIQISWKLVCKVVLMISRSSLNMGLLGSSNLVRMLV